MWSYEVAVGYLESLLNYETVGLPARQALRLDRMQRLLLALGQPQQQFRSIHITGTKGKGSVAHLLTAALQSLGYRVGLHTSPHLHAVEERLQVQGQTPAPEVFAELVNQILPHLEVVNHSLSADQVPLTYFEITTALAFWYFARQGVDWAVIEVGVGGRLDATNVILPELSILTSVSLDHTKLLGETTAAIAWEKAGIIKPGQPVVSAVLDPAAAAVIAQVAAQLAAPLQQLPREFDFQATLDEQARATVRVRTPQRHWPPLTLALRGYHQAANTATALAALDELAARARLTLQIEPVVDALQNVQIPGRFEILQQQATVVLDVAHNPAAITALLATLQNWQPFVTAPKSARHLIFACSRDKDWQQMLQLLEPHFGNFILTSFLNNPRALAPQELMAALPVNRLDVSAMPDPQSAWSQVQFALASHSAGSAVSAKEVVVITGSFYLVVELRDMFSRSENLSKPSA